MKSGLCRFVEQNIWKYLDRELSARRVAEISSHLKSCADCARLYEARAREASMYRVAFMGSPFGDEFCERFSGRLVEEIDELPRRDTAGRSILDGLLPVRGRWLAVSMAAMILFLAGLFVLTVYRLHWARRAGEGERPGTEVTQGEAPPPASAAGGGDSEVPPGRDGTGPALGRLEWLDDVGGDDVGSGGAERAGRTSISIQPVYTRVAYEQGARPVPARLRLADGSVLDFAARPWKFTVREQSRAGGPFVGEILEGTVDVRVTKREPSRYFTIFTPHAEVMVVGTEFDLEVSAAATVVTVTEGLVKVTDLRSRTPHLIGPADGAVRIPSEAAGAGDGDRAAGRSRRPEKAGAPRPEVDLDGPVNLRRE